MTFLTRFFLFDPPADPALLLQGSSRPLLVAVSIGVAIGSSALALQMAALAGRAPSAALRRLALWLGTLSLGAGVWAMHFIGMLAFQICTPMHYRTWPTIASMVPSLGAALVALRLLAKPQVRALELLAGGALMGGGIGLMHYGGMAALDMDVQLRYDPSRFVLSILVAVVLAMLALWIRGGLGAQNRVPRRTAAIAASLVMGAAISGMHYTAMSAARFIGRPAAGFVADATQDQALALGIALVTLVIGGLAAAINAVLGFRQINATLRASRTALQTTLTEQQRTEAALAESEQQHRSLIANIPGVAFRSTYDRVTGAMRLDFVSEASESLTGWHSRDFQAGLVDYATLVHPDDRARVLDFAQRRIDANGTYRLEYRVRARDGAERWVSETGTLSRGHADGLERVDGIVLDITESKLRNVEFEGVVRALRRGVAVVEFDLRGIVVAVNDRFLALTGYAADELLGQSHALLTGPAATERMRAARDDHWQALRRGEYRTAELRMLRKDGRRLWVQGSYNPILDADGLPRRTLTFITDLTDRRAMEVDLREAKERAEQAAAAKSTFLANMSHEIRTPMNAVIGFSEVVLEGELVPLQREHVLTINRAARSLLALLNDILDTAKLDQGAIEPEARDFSLRELCADLVATLRLGAENKGLTLALDYPPELDEWFVGDALRIQQILLNLAGNAVKFTEQGRVTVSVRQREKGIAIAVEDTGIGIAAERLERIFEPFAQADASMTRRFGGTGLGTTISRQLAHRMGGTIEVASRLGEGSCFMLTLPLAAGRRPPAADAAGMPVLPPLRVLVADDMPQNLELLQLRLGRLGHHVRTVGNGREALDCMARETFDVALIDIHMPVLDGLEASRQRRRHEHANAAPHLPLIALTASALLEDRRAAALAGMDGVAAKPLMLDQLLREIARVLRITPDAATTNPAATPAARSQLPVVDWPGGAERWGDRRGHLQHLRRFLRETLAAWGPPLPAGQPASAEAVAHRLLGAAGNLGLARVALAARAVGRTPDLADAWDELRRALVEADADVAVAAARTGDLEAEDAPDAHAAAPAAGSTGPGDAPARALPGAAQFGLLALCLRRGELDEGLAHDVAAALPSPQRQAFESALAEFDLDRAADILDNQQGRQHESA
ncbi:MAG: PAS domain-containing protein [Pseudomonadota bacterium]|nr:PAS domain-containing protein [Pseudomonadota bacterium]